MNVQLSRAIRLIAKHIAYKHKTYIQDCTNAELSIYEIGSKLSRNYFTKLRINFGTCHKVS